MKRNGNIYGDPISHAYLTLFLIHENTIEVCGQRNQWDPWEWMKEWNLNIAYSSFLFAVYETCIEAKWMPSIFNSVTLGKKGTIHQVTTMLATSISRSYNHLLTTSADDPSL